MKFTRGRYTQGHVADLLFETENWITEYALRNSMKVEDPVMKKDMQARIMDASLGRNEVIFDANDRPSIYVVYRPDEKAQMEWLSNGGALFSYSDEVHPAFMVDGNVIEFLVGKYQAVRVAGVNYACSLRGLDPAHTISLDSAMTLAQAKGPGHHVMTQAEWAYLTLLAMREGYQPRGNDNYGKSYQDGTERAEPSYVYMSGTTRYIGRTKTGAGPLSWYLDGGPLSPADMRGNVYEWLTGYRINAGEIQVLKDNNAANFNNSQAAASALWKAIIEDGSLVDPETADTLKWDYETPPPAGGTAGFMLNTQIEIPAPDSNAYGVKTFSSLVAKGGVTVPNLLKHLLIMPCASAPLGTRYMRNLGERFGSAGGLWRNTSNAGLGCLSSNNSRTRTDNGIGFRPAFYRTLRA